MPLVSVIMPTYNVEKYFNQCIESVINQTLKDIEIIPVDDGSPDSCGKIMDEYAKKDIRVKPIHQQNGGYGKAVNAGINIASGKYIAIVETDDWVQEDMLEVLVSSAEEKGANIVKAGFKKIHPDGWTCDIYPPINFYKNCINVDTTTNVDMVVAESSIWAALYNRDFLIKNNIKMLETKGAAYQDVVWKFDAYSSAKDIYCIHSIVYNYRVMTPNSSSKSTKNWDALFKNYEVIKTKLTSKNAFDEYKNQYYMHFFLDALFHYNRISDDTKSKFVERCRQYFVEANNYGITLSSDRFLDEGLRNYFYNDVRPFFENIVINNSNNTKDVYAGVDKGSVPHLGLKKFAVRLYHTALGQKCWHYFAKTLNRPKLKNKILNSVYCVNTNVKSDTFPMEELSKSNIPNYYKLEAPSNNNKVLIVMPWFDNNGSVIYIETVAKTFKSKNYDVHLFVYNEKLYYRFNYDSETWDKVFVKKADNPYFSHTNGTLKNPDCDNIDDWVSNDCLNSVMELYEHYRYDICIVNYLFYSKVFECLPSSVKKIIFTHDVFYRHNSRLLESGIGKDFFWFSVNSKEHEAKAMLRADIVIATQEREKKYFADITAGKVHVYAIPYVPERITCNVNFLNSKKLTVGYLASSNPPNTRAIMNVIKYIEKSKKDNFTLYIAGSVCDVIPQTFLPSNVKKLGRIDSITDFYSSYDLYVNPDMFDSGIKCKSVEVLSYGRPFVCTRIASTNLFLNSDYHNLNSEEECVNYIYNLANMNKDDQIRILNTMQQASSEGYDNFTNTYPLDGIISEIISI